MPKRFLFYFFIASAFISCAPQEKTISYKLSIQQTITLPAVAGASGIVLHKGNLIIVSDNMTGIFKADTNSFQSRFYPTNYITDSGVQDKSIKQDFENADIIQFKGKPYLVAFGSGSIEKTREQFLLAYADSLQKTIASDAGNFFTTLKQKLSVNTTQINIEGSFSTADSFYLLNRGTNQLVAMNHSTLEAVMMNDTPDAARLNIQSYSLPVQDSFPMAFSGACFYKDRQFLFTASVEKTSNWVADGDVAGSWIGLADLDGTISWLLPLQDEKGKAILQKLESIYIVRTYPNGNIELLAVADNDDEKSTLFRLMLSKAGNQ